MRQQLEGKSTTKPAFVLWNVKLTAGKTVSYKVRLILDVLTPSCSKERKRDNLERQINWSHS
jgi:hypothetical protein